jgi:hypothetical protein
VLGVQVAETEVDTGAAEAPAVVAVRRDHDHVANHTAQGILRSFVMYWCFIHIRFCVIGTCHEKTKIFIFQLTLSGDF